MAPGHIAAAANQAAAILVHALSVLDLNLLVCPRFLHDYCHVTPAIIRWLLECCQCYWKLAVVLGCHVARCPLGQLAAAATCAYWKERLEPVERSHHLGECVQWVAVRPGRVDSRRPAVFVD